MLGPAPARSFQQQRAIWLTAAAQLLDRHTTERLEHALNAMLDDEIFAGRALTLPDFEKVCDQLIARQHARSVKRRDRLPVATTNGHVSWSDARTALEKAVQHHGRDGREQALQQLAAVDEMLVRFVAQVRWSVLCQEPMQYAERRYKEIWAELSAAASREESVA